MKKIEEMRPMEFIDCLFEYLKSYNHYQIFTEDDKEQYRNSLYKLIFYTSDSQKSKNINTRLLEVGFSMENFSKFDQFLFYISLITLMHTSRDIIHKVRNLIHTDISIEESEDMILSKETQIIYKAINENGKLDKEKKINLEPNQKLWSYLSKDSIEVSYLELSFQFLILYYNYIRINDEVCNEPEDNKENAFILKYMDKLKLFHREESSNQVKKSIGKDETILCEYSRLQRYKGQLIILASRLTKIWSLLNIKYVDGYISYWLNFLNDFKVYVEYDRNSKKELDSWMLSIIFIARYAVQGFDLLSFKSYFLNSRKVEENNIVYSREMKDYILRVIENELVLLKNEEKNNIFSAFSHYLLFKQERNEYKFRKEIMEDLIKKASEIDSNYDSKIVPNIILTECMINSLNPNELIQLVIPDKKMQKSGLRNTIKNQVIDICDILFPLSKNIVIIDSTKSLLNIRIMYSQIYLDYTNKEEKNYNYEIMRYFNKEGKLKLDYYIYLKEKYIYGYFKEKGKLDQYVDYAKEQLNTIDTVINMFE